MKIGFEGAGKFNLIAFVIDCWGVGWVRKLAV